MYYFTSDIHFCDETTLKIDMRPFKNTKQFDKYIIKTWNKQTNKNDTIFVIGDLIDCDGPNYTTWKKGLSYIKKIKAKVILIIGNNEQRVIDNFFDKNFDAFKAYCKQLGIVEVYKNFELGMLNQQFYLVHKPIDYKSGVINLFGHTHRSTGIYKKFGFNVSCDLNHFRLYSENDIAQFIKIKEKFWDVDKNVSI